MVARSQTDVSDKDGDSGSLVGDSGTEFDSEESSDDSDDNSL